MQSKSSNSGQRYKTVLSIAGSDSIGGAGIQADIKTATSLGVYAMTAITAVTAQNTLGVQSFRSVGADMLKAQLDSIITDVHPDAIKIGMLPDRDAIDVVADFLNSGKFDNVVLDPVCVATSGDRLSETDTPFYLTEKLFASATLITPNLPEFMLFCNDTNVDAPAFVDRGMNTMLMQYGCKAVLLKGGHSENNHCTDILYSLVDSRMLPVWSLTAERVDTPNTHGTGCTLSTAIAGFMAKGLTLDKAVEEAVNWVHGAILAGADYHFGHGHGPVKHFYQNS